MALAAATVLAMSGLARAEVTYVIVISIDGGRGDFLQQFIETAPTEFPNFKRLRDRSARTFNARTDYLHSITIPDHLCMLTGRVVQSTGGVPASAAHGYTSDSPLTGETVHNTGLNAGTYKASILDAVHDRGLSTAVYLCKTRMDICQRSWDGTNGAVDTVGVDNGRNKIDFFKVVEAATPTLLSSFIPTITAGTLKNFTFFHIAETDYAGHSGGWSTSPGSMYREAMKSADGWVGQILDAVDANAALTNKVAIILTADHGGGTPLTSHTDSTQPSNYTIPFFCMAPGLTPGSDLYRWFTNRAEPGASRPVYLGVVQPIRNGDVANLAAALLGLPRVAGSYLAPDLEKRLRLDRMEDGSLTLTWPAYLTNYTLEVASSLDQTAWTSVGTGADFGSSRSYAVPPGTEGQLFFRLRAPGGAVGGAGVSETVAAGRKAVKKVRARK